MKKIILTTGALVSVLSPVIAVVSCSKTTSDDKNDTELQSNYSISSPSELLQIFKAANYNVSESEARQFYTTFSSLKADSINANVYRGKKTAEGYDEKSVYIVIKGIKQSQISKTDLTTVDPSIISFGSDKEKIFNVSSAYDVNLSQKEQSDQAPILFENFGINEKDLEDASFGILLSTKNGKNASVSMQQFKIPEIDPATRLYVQVGKFDTNIIGQIPTDTTKDKQYIPTELGAHDFKEIDNNSKQYAIAKNTKLPSEELFKNKLEEVLKAANNHINNLFESNISKQERIDNKGITRYFKITETKEIHWIDSGIDYLLQINDIADPTRQIASLPQLFNFVKATKVDDQSIVHDGEYYKTHIEGLKWKFTESDGTLRVDSAYDPTYQYMLAFAGLINSKELSAKTLLGLSLAKKEWLKP